MKTVDLYIRVDVAEQINITHSMAKQEAKLLEYCNRNNFQVRKTIVENYTGNTPNRPAWNKLMAEYCCPPPPVDRLLFYCFDRLSLIDTDRANMIKILNNYGVIGIAIEDTSIYTERVHESLIKSFPHLLNFNKN